MAKRLSCRVDLRRLIRSCAHTGTADWAYRLFVDLALGLHGTPEPMLASIDEMCVTDDGLEAELRAVALAALDRVDDVHGVVESLVEVAADGGTIVVKARGAGDAFLIRIHGDTSHLSPAMLEVVQSTLHDESRMLFLRAGFGRRTALLPPRRDPGRASAFFMEMRDEEGRLVDSAPARESEDLTHALADHDVDLIRYFSDGAPFWRAAFERGESVGDESLDSLHARRCWRWTPSAAS